MGNNCCGNEEDNISPVQKSTVIYNGLHELRRNFNLNHDTKLLGQGAFGKVYLTNNIHNPEHWVAIKVINKNKAGNKEKIYQEVKILNQLDHPNIVKYYETYDDPNGHIYLVMEYIKGGELLQKIESRSNNCLTEAEARDYCKHLFQALAHMHAQNVTHRDIKLENIMLTETDDVKFVDFGLGKQTDTSDKLMKTICGTPYYMAPELLKRNLYNSKCDIWSMGVIIYVLMSGYLPFQAENRAQLFNRIKRADYHLNHKEFETVSDEVKDLIKKIFVANPDERPTAIEILQHPWFDV